MAPCILKSRFEINREVSSTFEMPSARGYSPRFILDKKMMGLRRFYRGTNPEHKCTAVTRSRGISECHLRDSLIHDTQLP